MRRPCRIRECWQADQAPRCGCGQNDRVLTIWLDAWQMQCCGQPFEVGSEVTWTLVDTPDVDFLAAALGRPLADAVTHWEEHHGGLPAGAPETPVRVRSIRAVRCRYRPQPGTSTVYPLTGSTDIRDLRSADGWEEDDQDLRFVGYLVEADAV